MELCNHQFIQVFLAGIVSLQKISSEIITVMPTAINRNCNVFSYCAATSTAPVFSYANCKSHQPMWGRRKSSLKYAANPPTAVFDRLPNPDLLTTSKQNPHFTLSVAGRQLLYSSFVELSLRLDCCIWASMPRKRSWDLSSTRGAIAHPKFLKALQIWNIILIESPFLPCHFKSYHTGSRKKFVLPWAG